MTTAAPRRALVALAVAAALLPASPALAQTATPTAPVSPTPTPTASPTASPSPTSTPSPTPQPASGDIQAAASVVESGGTVLVAVSGAVGARADLYGNGRLIRQGAVLLDRPGEPAGSFVWELQPGDTTAFSAVVDGARTRNVVVRVRRTVTIGIRQAGGVYTFTGTVRRPERGLQVTVARLDAVSKRVTGVASAVTDAAGNYTIRTALPVGLAGYYTLTAPTASLDAGRSRLYGLVVPRPAAPTSVGRPVQPFTAPRPPTTTRPADRDCDEFGGSQPAAQAFFDRYRSQFGDFADLDRNRDGIACNALR